MNEQKELPIIQRSYDLILWYVPRLNKFPRNFKYILGDRIQTLLYEILELLIEARYARDKVMLLEMLNVKLEVLRYQTRICRDLNLFDLRRYEYAVKHLNEIGNNLGGWLRQQRRKQ